MPLPMTSWSDFRKPTTSGSKLNELAETGAARHDGPANTGGLPAVRLVTRRRPPPDGIRRTRTGLVDMETRTWRRSWRRSGRSTWRLWQGQRTGWPTSVCAWSRPRRHGAARHGAGAGAARRRNPGWPVRRGSHGGGARRLAEGHRLPARARRERTPGHRVSCAPKSPFLEANGMAVICNQNFPCYFSLVDRI